MPITAGTQKKQWVIMPADKRVDDLAGSLRIPPLLAQVLLNRGITEPGSGGVFLRPKLTELIPPEKMPGIDNAIARIKQAIQKKQKITVYGDYDVDGITGVAILWQLLTLLGADVDYYIPHRIDEGYGLNAQAVETISKAGTQVLITVDCGVTDLESAKQANRLGMVLIITDHHQFADELPEAAAIVHPALDADYLNQDSAGALVAYKLAWAIANEFNPGQRLEPVLRDFMINATTLAAIGTVADVVDLRGENRIVTSYGLSSLPGCSLCGIQALIETAGLTGQGLDSFHIGFRLAPMINAAGRMGHARLAVELLTTESAVRAKKIAEYLKEQNELRRRFEQKIVKQACAMIADRRLNHPDTKTIVLADDNWHTGVIGIVASRIIDKYYRPTIIINTSNGLAQGSGRSIEGFDILKAIKACSKHLKSFGGHKMAAGLKIPSENIEQFAHDFELYAREHLCEDEQVEKMLIDAHASLCDFNHHVVTEIQRLEPFGKGNPSPMFATKGVRLAAPPRKVGTKGDHLQIAVTDNKTSVRCIGFGMGKYEKKLVETEYFNIAYEPQINEFNGSSNVQLVLKDIQFE